MFNPFPENIKTIAIVAPAGPTPAKKIESGCSYIESFGIKVKLMPGVYAGSELSYLSADIYTRVNDLQKAWLDEENDMILCTRGGYGSASLLPFLDWESLKSRNIPVVGYSDITALHLAMLKMEAGTPVAGPMCAMLPKLKNDSYTLEYYKRALSESTFSPEELPEKHTKLTPLNPGNINAPVIAVNLAVLVTLCGTQFMPDLTGKVLIVEDIGEPVYKLDRYFTQLRQNGILDNLAGLVFGTFTDCGNKAECDKLFSIIAKGVNFPVFSGFPFGHSFPLISIRQGSMLNMRA